jgi:hypothetical protein
MNECNIYGRHEIIFGICGFICDNLLYLPKAVPSTIITYASKLISGFIYVVIKVTSGHSAPIKTNYPIYTLNSLNLRKTPQNYNQYSNSNI